MPGIIIQSNNFNGKSVQITFSPFSGGSINLGTQIIPYTYTTSNYEGNYSIYIPEDDKTCALEVGTPPSPTPTSTNTPTPTLTPTNTPTPTPSGTSIDPDAAAYLADIVISGGTITPTIESAVDTLFTSLKSNGLYSKMLAFYPYVGGTAGSHAINANLNKTYDITWYGGMSHGISGSTGNASNGYGDTNVPMSAYTNLLYTSFGFYVNQAGTIGRSGGIAVSGYGFIFSEGGNVVWRHGQVTSGNPGLGITGDTRGMWSSVKEGSDVYNLYKNGNFYNTRSSLLNISSDPGLTFYYFRANNPTNPNYSNTNLSFGYLSNNLLNSEISTLHSIINTFQTSLGRNTY